MASDPGEKPDAAWGEPLRAALDVVESPGDLVAEWGWSLAWPCGHRALTVARCDLWAHPHRCPVCRPAGPACPAGYLDVRRVPAPRRGEDAGG